MCIYIYIFSHYYICVTCICSLIAKSALLSIVVKYQSSDMLANNKYRTRGVMLSVHLPPIPDSTVVYYARIGSKNITRYSYSIMQTISKSRRLNHVCFASYNAEGNAVNQRLDCRAVDGGGERSTIDIGKQYLDSRNR